MSENTMAVKLQKLKNLNAAIAGLGAGYNPTKDEIKAATLSAKETSLETLNTQINSMETTLNDKQEDRFIKTYAISDKDGFEGLIKKSRRVAGVLENMGSEFKDKAELARRAVNKMAPNQTRRKKKDENDRTRSTSEKSFDSIFAQANKIALMVTAIPEYTPADTTIDAPTYTANVTELINLSSEISGIFDELIPVRKEREREMKNLPKVITASKNYIKNSYGELSPEYMSVKDI